MLDLSAIEAEARALATTDARTAETLLALCARVRELEAALKPFCDESERWMDTLPDDYRPAIMEAETYKRGMAGDIADFTLGDFRRARAALGVQ